ncbi:MAG TPA: TetR family transcriptional regulator [Intrasporangium sp.]|uniref:acyl-CoA-like ligand-binding transcription factor n=1 Tax=Intrasporangium sp. TaxID=1925024 RepID=UPI002B48F27F|nr:TetR family transcriptional regulator [Intrasporangium sp.]HKX69530.1 TetR family transcriptional regulator [Intrasporangium sp.]
MTEECGLRERKKRETRLAIHRAALDLVEEAGFDAVTTDQIAASAGVSPRTFFNYFPTKESAVLGSTPADLDEMRAQLEARPADEPILDSIRAIVRDRLAPSSQGPELRAQRRRVLLGEPALGPALVGTNIHTENVLTDVVAARLGVDPKESVRPRVTVATALAAVRACIEHQQTGGTGTVEDTVDEAFALLGTGLA